jgi:hypothetical protein
LEKEEEEAELECYVMEKSDIVRGKRGQRSGQGQFSQLYYQTGGVQRNVSL